MIGMFVGIVLALCGVLDKEYTMLVMLFAVPAGAMLPDIDHNNTKIGRKRKKVLNDMKKLLPVGFIVFVLAVVYSFEKGVGVSQLLPVICVVVSFLLLVLVGSSKWGRQKFRFFTKHRGIMHTLCVPAVCVYITVTFELHIVMEQLLLGAAAGYLTHLVADCLTIEGCPILWPLTTRCVKIPLAATNTKSEKIVAVLLCGVFAVGVPLLYRMVR